MKKSPKAVITGCLVVASLMVLFVALPTITADYYRGEAQRVLERLQTNVHSRKAELQKAFAASPVDHIKVDQQLHGLATDIEQARQALPDLQTADELFAWSSYYHETKKLSASISRFIDAAARTANNPVQLANLSDDLSTLMMRF